MTTKGSNNRAPAARKKPRLHRWPRRVLIGSALGIAAFDASAQTIDLVDHNGFEQCWSKALSTDGFLQLLASATEGADACLPAAADGSACATSMCTGGSPGCAVTLRAGQYSVGQIQLASSLAEFNASNSFDPFSMPVVLPIVGACTVNFVDTASVVIQYPLDYSLAPDGNNGYYADQLALGSSGALVTGLTTSNYSLSGGLGCQLANIDAAYLASVLQSEMQMAIPVTLAPATVGQSLCPLP